MNNFVDKKSLVDFEEILCQNDIFEFQNGQEILGVQKQHSANDLKLNLNKLQ